MLEKIGLPAKPSLRGSAWVVDASHCQGCSSQFTFINRKHHCRRCGGIFCNGCTQQRMNLRGQGDSPVRICEPCRTLEEAARFELRYGNKNRAGRGSSRSTSKHEDEILNQNLGNDEKKASSAQKSTSDLVSRIQRPNSTASCTSSDEMLDGREGTRKNPTEEFNHVSNEIEPASPEKLRQQAVDEKKRYKILKGEGKPEEALKAFKRGKELERQADALEITIRKNRRKVLLSENMAEMQNEDNPRESGRKRAPISQVSKGKDDLLSELKDLGWTDTDLHDEDKKPVNKSIEGELSSLLGEFSQKPKKDAGPSGIDKSQVVAHKRKALALKRAGNLVEAKEELKKAKILEKELEEQELLGGAEDSDDELSAMIRSMDDDDDDKQDELIAGHGLGRGSDFDHLLGTVGDLDDRNLELTDDDLMDPEMAAALHSLGWADESDNQQNNELQSVAIDRESLLMEIDSLKREAVNRKKAGNVAEAMALLKNAKLLEREMGSLDSGVDNSTTTNSSIIQKDSVSRSIPSKKDSKVAPKNRLMIQKELLALKKKALALRREGKLDEAEEELRKGRVLEQQLEEIDNASKDKANLVTIDTVEPKLEFDQPIRGNTPTGEMEADVTDEDLHDPAYLSLLSNLGWKEDDELPSSLSKSSKEDDNHSIGIVEPSVTHATYSSSLKRPKRSKGELQRELLGLKRKALALRRQGKIDEADEVLQSAKELETQMEEMDNSLQTEIQVKSNVSKDDRVKLEDKKDEPERGDNSFQITVPAVALNSSDNSSMIPRRKGEIQRELLGLKRKALALRRQGKTDEADEVLRSAKALEAQIEQLEEPEKEIQFDEQKQGSHFITPLQTENAVDLPTGDDRNDHQPIPAEKHNIKANLSFDVSHLPEPHMQVEPVSNSPENFQTRESIDSDEKPQTDRRSSTQKLASQNNQNPLQQEILARKRKAVALKREGNLSEAREELRQAKLLEKSLESGIPENKSGTINTSQSISDSPEKEPSRSNLAAKPLTGRDRFKLQQESLSHKRQALKLRREGRTEEAEAEFELAKNLEMQLEEMDSVKSSVGMAGQDNDVGVEDFLDPQLLSALKSLGIEDSTAASKRPEKDSTAASKRPEKVSPARGENVIQERIQLEEQIKAEKIKALSLKRSGKQAEALEALRRSKLYEKKLNSLTST